MLYRDRILFLSFLFYSFSTLTFDLPGPWGWTLFLVKESAKFIVPGFLGAVIGKTATPFKNEDITSMTGRSVEQIKQQALENKGIAKGKTNSDSDSEPNMTLAGLPKHDTVQEHIDKLMAQQEQEAYERLVIAVGEKEAKRIMSPEAKKQREDQVAAYYQKEKETKAKEKEERDKQLELAGEGKEYDPSVFWDKGTLWHVQHDPKPNFNPKQNQNNKSNNTTNNQDPKKDPKKFRRPKMCDVRKENQEPDPRTQGIEEPTLPTRDKPGQYRHQFRYEAGHIQELTGESRRILNRAWKEGKHLGQDASGNHQIVWTNPEDGNQIWIKSLSNGRVTDCGANTVHWGLNQHGLLEQPWDLSKELAKGVKYADTVLQTPATKAMSLALELEDLRKEGLEKLTDKEINDFINLVGVVPRDFKVDDFTQWEFDTMSERVKNARLSKPYMPAIMETVPKNAPVRMPQMPQHKQYKSPQLSIERMSEIRSMSPKTPKSFYDTKSGLKDIINPKSSGSFSPSLSMPPSLKTPKMKSNSKGL